VKQILYTSKSTATAFKADLNAIPDRSRHNNAADGVTGLLWSDGQHFIQVLEGPEASVIATAARIRADTRHRDINLLHELAILKPEFGTWEMAHCRAGDPPSLHDRRMRGLLADAAFNASHPIYGLIAAERA
jgi:hypothetical protein